MRAAVAEVLPLRQRCPYSESQNATAACCMMPPPRWVTVTPRLLAPRVGRAVCRWAQVGLAWDPFSVGGDAWLDEARAALAAHTAATGTAAYLNGPSGGLDGVRVVLAAFPLIVGLSAVVVLALAGEGPGAWLQWLHCFAITLVSSRRVGVSVCAHPTQDGYHDWCVAAAAAAAARRVCRFLRALESDELNIWCSSCTCPAPRGQLTWWCGHRHSYSPATLCH